MPARLGTRANEYENKLTKVDCKKRENEKPVLSKNIKRLQMEQKV